MHTFISSHIFKKKINQAYLKLHLQVHSSLPKAANSFLYQKECNIVPKICEDNFDAFNPQAQEPPLPEFCKDSGFSQYLV